MLSSTGVCWSCGDSYDLGECHTRSELHAAEHGTVRAHVASSFAPERGWDLPTPHSSFSSDGARFGLQCFRVLQWRPASRAWHVCIHVWVATIFRFRDAYNTSWLPMNFSGHSILSGARHEASAQRQTTCPCRDHQASKSRLRNAGGATEITL